MLPAVSAPPRRSRTSSRRSFRRTPTPVRVRRARGPRRRVCVGQVLGVSRRGVGGQRNPCPGARAEARGGVRGGSAVGSRRVRGGFAGGPAGGPAGSARSGESRCRRSGCGGVRGGLWRSPRWGPRWVRGGGRGGDPRGVHGLEMAVVGALGVVGSAGPVAESTEDPRWVCGGDPRGSDGLESTFSWGVTTLIVASWSSLGLVVSWNTVVAGSAAPFWYRQAVASK